MFLQTQRELEFRPNTAERQGPHAGAVFHHHADETFEENRSSRRRRQSARTSGARPPQAARLVRRTRRRRHRRRSRRSCRARAAGLRRIALRSPHCANSGVAELERRRLQKFSVCPRNDIGQIDSAGTFLFSHRRPLCPRARCRQNRWFLPDSAPIRWCGSATQASTCRRPLTFH